MTSHYFIIQRLVLGRWYSSNFAYETEMTARTYMEETQRNHPYDSYRVQRLPHILSSVTAVDDGTRKK